MTVAPRADTDVGLADLVSERLAVWLALTVAVEDGEVTVPPAGAVPRATAVLVIEPAFRSAWVVV